MGGDRLMGVYLGSQQISIYGGGGKPEEEKTVTAGTSVIEVKPSSGKVMKKVTINPTPTETKEVLPTVTDQTYNPPEGKHFSQFTVKGDSDLIAENIKEGVNIFGIDGKLSDSGGTPIAYEYTGSSNVSYSVELDSEGNSRILWELKLLSSGILKIKKLSTKILDVFLVGGGGGGAGGYSGIAGGGGGGGYVKTELDVSFQKNVNYDVVIGSGGVGGGSGNYPNNTVEYTKGGTGGSTSIFGISVAGGNGGTHANYGKGGDGGSGGGASYTTSSMYPGKGSGSTTKAFGTGDVYAGGGAGGLSIDAESTTYYYYNGGNGGSNGGNGSKGTGFSHSIIDGTGGAGGGGDSSKDGTANTGGGGGGGNNVRTSGRHDSAGKGSSGGSGIVILRGRYS